MNKRIVFFGTPEFAATVLERLHRTGYEIITCITQPDKPVGRHMILTPPPAKSMAISLDIPVLQPESLRKDDFLTTIVELAPDLIITAAYGKILPAAVLSVPQNGSINVHASLLPKYRGAAPVQWAILNGDTITGVTIMKMDVGMDTGDILSSRECEIGPNETTEELMQRLADIGADLLLQTITPYLSGELHSITQDNRRSTLSPPIRKEQGLIDWSQSSTLIHNQIRALTGWPGAYSIYKGARLKIYTSVLPTNQPELLEMYRNDYEIPLPGTIIRGAKSGIYVACGEGCIILTSVQPQSCRRMHAHECGHNYRTGTRFDEETA